MGSYEVESKFKILFLTYEQQLDSWTEIPNLEIILKRATSIKNTGMDPSFLAQIHK